MSIKPQSSIDLAPLTTFRVGGSAEYYVSVQTVDGLLEALGWARSRRVPMAILGGGSNVVIADQGVPGLVIHPRLPGVEWIDHGDNSVTVVAGAGESWDSLVKRAVEKDLWGLENLSGIPGSVGAAPVQNIGAYGVEFKDSFEWLEAVDSETAERRTFSPAECGFSYRWSFFKSPAGRRWIITRVALRLTSQPRPNLSYRDLVEYFADSGQPSLSDIRRAVLAIRYRKFPDLSVAGTAGSFFTNPLVSQEELASLRRRFPELPAYEVSDETVKVPAAWLLDKACGLKGYRRGPVRLFESQPLVVVAESGATAEDIKSLAREVQATVRDQTGVELVREVRYLPEDL